MNKEIDDIVIELKSMIRMSRFSIGEQARHGKNVAKGLSMLNRIRRLNNGGK